jgi:hypothetical protein
MELQVSSDGGATWSSPRPLIPNAPARQDDPQIVVDPVDGAGDTHAIWGEGPSYAGPGNVWYAGQ